MEMSARPHNMRNEGQIISKGYFFIELFKHVIGKLGIPGY